MANIKAPDSVYVIKSVPHDWLFPYMAAVVHHGGAGTIGAGLRAGKPAVVCPVVGDQFFLGNIIYGLGVAPKPIPQKKLSVDNLAEAIKTAVTDKSMKKGAEALKDKVRSEDGPQNAVNFINVYLSNLESRG